MVSGVRRDASLRVWRSLGSRAGQDGLHAGELDRRPRPLLVSSPGRFGSCGAAAREAADQIGRSVVPHSLEQP